MDLSSKAVWQTFGVGGQSLTDFSNPLVKIQVYQTISGNRFLNKIKDEPNYPWKQMLANCQSRKIAHVAAPENKQDDIVRIVNAGVPNIVRLNEADVGSGDR